MAASQRVVAAVASQVVQHGPDELAARLRVGDVEIALGILVGLVRVDEVGQIADIDDVVVLEIGHVVGPPMAYF